MDKINNYKKSFICIIIVFLFSFLLINFSVVRYSRSAVVVSNDGKVLTFEDTTGNLWKWSIESTEEFKMIKGDKVKLTFNDQGTDNTPKDDIIIKVKKKD